MVRHANWPGCQCLKESQPLKLNPPISGWSLKGGPRWSRKSRTISYTVVQITWWLYRKDGVDWSTTLQVSFKRDCNSCGRTTKVVQPEKWDVRCNHSSMNAMLLTCEVPISLVQFLYWVYQVSECAYIIPTRPGKVWASRGSETLFSWMEWKKL